jgi:polyferredoxin
VRRSPSGRPGRRGPRAARAAVLAAQAAVLAAAAFGFLAAGLVPDRARALVASWQLFPGISRALRAVAEAAAGGAAAAATALAAAAGLAIPVLLLSAVFGRWYCAALCPLGALQDLAALAPRSSRRYGKGPTAARAAAAICAIALSIAGAAAAASWLDPWSIFGRLAGYDIRPIVQAASRVDAHSLGFWTAVPALAAAAAILVLSALSRSRWFCGTLCPVGSLLGLLNKLAPFRLRLDGPSCVACGACAAACPASCIDPERGSLDATRCVSCLACVAACPTRAIRYGRARRDVAASSGASNGASSGAGTPPPRRSAGGAMPRSSFLAVLAGGAAAIAIAAIPGRAAARRAVPRAGIAVPPGAGSALRFIEACTACGLCVSACPSSVLQPSLGELGPRGLFVPRLDFSVSYCQYECVSCSAVCPSGALARVAVEPKKLIKIGTASLVKDHCIVFTERTKCGACAEHCPTGAVRMAEGSTGLPEPVFDGTICIGCGACHHICPVPGKRAISVAGLAVHETAVRPPEAQASPADSVDRSGSGSARGREEFPF